MVIGKMPSLSLYRLQLTRAFLPAMLLFSCALGSKDAFSQTEPPFELPPAEQLNTIRAATIYTSKGQIEFELFPQVAPWHVANFKYRADKGYYRNSSFHIFYPDYIIQAGGPANKPAQSANYQLPPEFNQYQHHFGTLGMARKPDMVNPARNSSGNQFHILLGDAPHMDGAFTVFGQLERGEQVLRALEKDDRVLDVKVFVVQAHKSGESK